MTLLDPEERLFSLGDLIRLYHREKRKMVRAALLCAACLGLFAITRPIEYRAEASFKESLEKKEALGSLQEMLLNVGGSADGSQAAILMKSNRVLKPLVCSLGLQAQIAEERRSFLQNLFDHLRSEMGFCLPDLDSFVFRDVVYEGEKPLCLKIRFLDSDQFEVNGVLSRLKEQVQVGDATFRMERAPKKLNWTRRYNLTIGRWSDATQKIRKSLKIIAQKTNKSVLELTFSHRDRVLSSSVLNALMNQYATYLKSEHDQLDQDQLAYLGERQGQVFEGLDRALQDHMRYLQESTDQKGFANAEQQTKSFLTTYQKLFDQRLAAELELEKLQKGLFDQPEILRARAEIERLDSERDLLASTLFSRMPNPMQVSSAASQHLQQVRQDLDEVTQALKTFEKDPVPLQLDPHLIVQNWALTLAEGHQEDFAYYLRRLIRLYSMREKLLRERQFQPELSGETFEGINLETARELLVASNRELDELLASIATHRHLLSRVQDPTFELTSLGTILGDPVSQRLLDESYRLHLQIKDQEHYSDKEESRLARDLAQQRKVVGEHIQQILDVTQLKKSLCEEKIASLQRLALDCIHQEISIYRQQIDEFTRDRKQALVQGKELLAKKMEELRTQMAAIPGQKHAELLLKLRTEMGLRTMQSVTQLVESKTISHHLHHVESKPVDVALTPLKPPRGQVSLLSLAGAALGALASFSWAFVRGVYRGFPAAADTLQALNYPVAGCLSFHVDGPQVETLFDEDLEALRRVASLIDGSQRIGLFAGEGPDYSYELARLLAQEGRKVLLIRCDFKEKFSDRDLPGLLQAVSGDLQIRKEAAFDLLPSGGFTRYGTELIRSENFLKLLEELAKDYDHLLLYTTSSLNSAESLALLARCQACAVTVVNEPIELLTPFTSRAYHQERCRLTFLTVRL